MPSIRLFPFQNAAFFTWQHNFMDNLAPRRVAYGVGDDEWAALTARQAAYVEKYAAAENPATRTSAAIVARVDARRALEDALRTLIRRRLNFNPAVDDEARRSLGLTVYKTARTPAPVATEPPAAECDTSVHGRVAIHFFPSDSVRKKGRPDGQRGVEIVWDVRDAPPARWDELWRSSFDARSPAVFVFENDRRGQTFYYALRWVNTRDEKGPWSDIAPVMIP